MAYPRKTTDEYEIQGNCGRGWDRETPELITAAMDCYEMHRNDPVYPAAPHLLMALELAEATLQRIAPDGSRATQGTRDVITAAIKKAGGARL